MADRRQLETIYSRMDRIFRRSLGEHGDYSGALFDGDFALSLEEAQARKHALILHNLGLQSGERVLDLGCGWGGFLDYARRAGLQAVGVTLSDRQAASCRRHGLDVRVADCRTLRAAYVGCYDGLVSLGAFEHFCSPQEHAAGRQETVYRGFFRHAADLIPAGRRFFLQTMVFGRAMIPRERIDIHAPRGSDAYAVALMSTINPGSWLPAGVTQVLDCATPWFVCVEQLNGRRDYIETLARWKRRFLRFDPLKYAQYLSFLPLAVSLAVRRQFEGLLRLPNKVCFERELFDHFRLTLERTVV